MPFPTYLELCRLTWRQYLARFDLILILALLIALPIHLLVSLALPEIPALANVTTLADLYLVISTDPAVWEMLVWNALSSTTLLFFTTALVVTLRASYQKRSLRLSSILRHSTHFYVRVLLTSILVGVATAIGLLFFILPGIVIGVYLSLAVPVVVWENKSPFAALRRSIALVHGQARYIFLYILTTQLLLSLLIWVIISIMPLTLPFEIFSLTVSSLITAFEIFFETVLFTACATWWHAEHMLTAAKKGTTAKLETNTPSQTTAPKQLVEPAPSAKSTPSAESTPPAKPIKPDSKS